MVQIRSFRVIDELRSAICNLQSVRRRGPKSAPAVSVSLIELALPAQLELRLEQTR
jgi:hypothetical protein